MTMQRRSAPSALLVLSALLIVLSGCDDIVVLDEPGAGDPQPDVVDPECTIDADCTGGATCTDGSCVAPQCTVDGDCADGQRCADGACVNSECLFTECPVTVPSCDEEGRRVSYTGTEITADCVCDYLEVSREVSDCPDGTVCSEGECQNLCDEVTCPETQFFCIEGTPNVLSVAFTCNPGTGECEQGEAQTESCGDSRGCIDDVGCVERCMVDDDCTDEPRAPACLDGDSREFFVFSCTEGLCIQTRQAEDCENLEPSCSSPPLFALTYDAPAICNEEGQCESPPVIETNCNAEGKTCIGGECVEVCEDVDDETFCPAEQCSGDRSRVLHYDAPGFCIPIDGMRVCSFEEIGLEEEVCLEGEECVDGVAGPECDFPGGN